MINLIFILSIGIFIAFEINKLTDFNFFYKMIVISSDYSKNIAKRENSNVLKCYAKFALAEIAYSMITLIGIFTINYNIFFIIILLSVIKTLSFKYFKNKNIRKLIIIIDSILTILLLSAILVNLLFYKTTDILFITNLYKHIF
jgi:hypothetical protein